MQNQWIRNTCLRQSLKFNALLWKSMQLYTFLAESRSISVSILKSMGPLRKCINIYEHSMISHQNPRAFSDVLPNIWNNYAVLFKSMNIDECLSNVMPVQGMSINIHGSSEVLSLYHIWNINDFLSTSINQRFAYIHLICYQRVCENQWISIHIHTNIWSSKKIYETMCFPLELIETMLTCVPKQ